MLYILTGDDVSKAKERATKLAKGFEVVKIGEGGEDFGRAQSYLGSSGLFSKKIALIIERPLETAEGKELFKELKKFLDSETLAIIVEPDLDAATRKLIPKNAEVETFESKKSTEPSANVFALADSFGAGDRKKSWILYRQFIEDGASAEEIHGILSWQVRAMVLASKTESAEEAGLKPFVYTKAKRASSRLKDGEVDTLSRELVSLYHQSRGGMGELESLLEVFLLKR